MSGFTIPEIEPRLFSFNNPFGACPTCDGLGVKLAFDADLVVPDRDKTLHKGAIAPWSRGPSPLYTQTLQSLSRHYGFSMDVAWRDLPAQAHKAILDGTGAEKIKFTYDDGMRRYDTKKEFEGVIPNMDRRYGETDSAWVREELGRFQSDTPCESCHGKRLKPEALAVKVYRQVRTAQMQPLAALKHCKEHGQTIAVVVNVPTSSMAREAAMSRSRFSDRFKALVGDSTIKADRCCGESGTLAVSRPDISTQIRFRKHEELQKNQDTVRADGFQGEVKVLTSCPSCLQGLSRYEDETKMDADYIEIAKARILAAEKAYQPCLTFD